MEKSAARAINKVHQHKLQLHLFPQTSFRFLSRLARGRSTRVNQTSPIRSAVYSPRASIAFITMLARLARSTIPEASLVNSAIGNPGDAKSRTRSPGLLAKRRTTFLVAGKCLGFQLPQYSEPSSRQPLPSSSRARTRFLESKAAFPAQACWSLPWIVVWACSGRRRLPSFFFDLDRHAIGDVWACVSARATDNVPSRHQPQQFFLQPFLVAGEILCQLSRRRKNAYPIGGAIESMNRSAAARMEATSIVSR